MATSGEDMNVPAGNLMVRIHPSKFWSATRLMTAKERDILLDAITKMAEAGDVAGLEHFDFISVELIGTLS